MSESNSDHSSQSERRAFLKYAGIGGTAVMTGLAGCTGGQDGGGTTTTETETETTTTTTTDTGDNQSGKTYKVGAAWPYSGDLAPFGPRDERGMKLAFKSVNKAGVLGGTMKASIQDTQTSQSSGVSAAQKLVNQENVPVLIAACSSGVSVAIAKSVTIPNKVLQVIPNSTSPAITKLKDERYVCRTAVSDALQGKALAQIANKEGVKKAAILMVNNDYGTGFANAMQKAFEANGGTITKKVAYESGKASYKPQLNSAMEGNPEALVFIAYPQSFTTMVKQAYEMGLKDKVKYLAGESIVSNAVEQNVPAKAMNGMVGTNPSPPVQSDRYKNFQQRFKDEYDKSPTVWAAYTYDATMLTALALQKSGTFKSKPLRDAIYQVSRPPGKEVNDFATAKKELENGNNINYQGVSGSVDLNKAGDVPGTYRRWVVENGKFQMKDFIEVKA